MIKETMRRIDDRSVESSLGWKIDILSGNSFGYTEESGTIKFEIEDRPDELGNMEWIIYLPTNWIWEKPHDDRPVAPEKISEILNRIDLAFWKLDMTIREIV
jgi:hypothetical protein